jgi:hypothetical protein
LIINSSSGFSENNACCEKNTADHRGIMSEIKGPILDTLQTTINNIKEQSNTVQPANTGILTTNITFKAALECSI